MKQLLDHLNRSFQILGNQLSFFSHFTIIRIKSWRNVVCPEKDAGRVEALAAHTAERVFAAEVEAAAELP
jgi:hypothetical protein